MHLPPSRVVVHALYVGVKMKTSEFTSMMEDSPQSLRLGLSASVVLSLRRVSGATFVRGFRRFFALMHCCLRDRQGLSTLPKSATHSHAFPSTNKTLRATRHQPLCWRRLP